MTIPIRNLYYLFAYAWAKFPDADVTDTGIDECPEILDLFAHLLVRYAKRIFRQGLARDYLTFEEEIPAPRGKIALQQTIRRQTLLRSVLACEYDELSVNRVLNQIIKATARILAWSTQVTERHRAELRSLVSQLRGVDNVKLDFRMFRALSLKGDMRRYRPVISMCELVFKLRLPAEDGSGTRFADVLENEVTMSSVFEMFLRNFYASEQSSFSVGAEVMHWDVEPLDAVSATLLPVMKTDITLRSPDRILVIDAKYYSEALKIQYERPKLRPNHLYQLFAYMEHSGQLRPRVPVDGALIYPAAGHSFSAAYVLAGHGVRAEALDLTRPWLQIREELLLYLTPASRKRQHGWNVEW